MTQSSPKPADYRFETRDGVQVVTPSGDWTVLCLGDAPVRLAGQVKSGKRRFEAADLGRIDTAGAFALVRLLHPTRKGDAIDLDVAGRDDLGRLADMVSPALDLKPAPPARHMGGFERIGRGLVNTGRELLLGQAFLGQLIIALARTARHPSRLRLTPLAATMEQAGVGALPIVAAMCFFIGAVLALVGSTMLETLGVKVYSVELVGLGVMREFGAVIAAILFAGRSASAFAAQLGSMVLNQEIDAMRVMGVDRFSALVVPRVVAAVLMLPLLTFVADLGGIVGGMLVSWAMMDIQPAFFLERLVQEVGAQQFWIGMSKTPFFAVVIAATGCRQGLSASGDVESLGRCVTAAVVQSIFLVIMFDALFAVMYRALGL